MPTFFFLRVRSCIGAGELNLRKERRDGPRRTLLLLWSVPFILYMNLSDSDGWRLREWRSTEQGNGIHSCLLIDSTMGFSTLQRKPSAFIPIGPEQEGIKDLFLSALHLLFLSRMKLHQSSSPSPILDLQLLREISFKKGRSSDL